MKLCFCSVDLVRARVIRNGEDVVLTTREADLLRYFAANPSRVIPRDELLEKVWGYSDAVLTRASDNTIRRLRTKIEADPARPDHLLTVHGVGYRFELLGASLPEPAPSTALVWHTLAAGVQVDLVRRRVRRDNSEVDLAESEAALLAELLKSESFVERDTLQRAVWGRERRGARALDGIVVRLRQKLERDPSTPEIIKTARGGGYRLQRPDPAQQAGLLGRDALIAEITEAHQRPGLVLLLGFAGVGKSSLARAVDPDAPWIDLAAAATPSDAARIAAAALDIALGSEDPVEQMGVAIARRADARIILDNIEGISGISDLLSCWLACAPRTRWLATSRIRTEVDGEHVIDVGPLPLAEATALFVRHAQRASSAGRNIQADDPLVTEIVERLDRIPLAIMLAAARTSVLDLDSLHAGLASQTLKLPHPARSARHPSLDLAVQGSLSGLTDPENDALYTLSMFGSRFDIDDVEALLGSDAIDLLQALRDRSLLRRLPSGGFGLWQVVRESLSRSVPDPIVRRWIAHIAHWGEPEFLEHFGWEGSDEEVAHLVRQVGDVERACRLALARGEPDLAAACASAVVLVCVTHGPYAPGVALAEAVLAALPAPAARARLLCELGALRNALGQWGESLRETSEASALACEIGDSALEIRARVRAAGMAREIHGSEAARDILTPAPRLAPGAAWRHVGVVPGSAVSLLGPARGGAQLASERRARGERRREPDARPAQPALPRGLAAPCGGARRGKGALCHPLRDLRSSTRSVGTHGCASAHRAHLHVHRR